MGLVVTICMVILGSNLIFLLLEEWSSANELLGDAFSSFVLDLLTSLGFLAIFC